MGKTGKLIILGVVALFLMGIFSWIVGVSNSERKLLLRGKAAQENSQVVFDNTWKTIRDQASVSDKYKEAFKDVYIGMMSARYASDSSSGKQTLMKWITESNPTLDASIYKTLMNTIEGSRNEFTMEQKKLIDIDRQHKTLKATFPNSLIIGNRPDLEIKIVTSNKTKAAFDSGEDNDDPLAPTK